MQLFIKHIAHQIESLNDLKKIDKSLLNINEIKAISFLENWFHNKDFVFQSSGSTGVPKQFIFTKEELIWSATQTNNYLSLNKKPPHFFICLDIHLVAGAMLLARAILLNAKVTIINPSSNPFETLSENHPYTFASLVPMQLQSILKTANGIEILNQFKNILNRQDMMIVSVAHPQLNILFGDNLVQAEAEEERRKARERVATTTLHAQCNQQQQQQWHALRVPLRVVQHHSR